MRGATAFFFAEKYPEKGYQDWVDSFWAKDIQEIFRVENRSAFLKFFELLNLQSGGLFETKSFTASCGVTHPTIANYLDVLDRAHVAFPLRPYHKNSSKEVISMKKVYFFDTGFINFFRGHTTLQTTERGQLYEHLVLNELLGFCEQSAIHYWRDKRQNEIDFILKLRGRSPTTIEGKWKAKEFDPRSVKIFREIHDPGLNIVIASDILNPFSKKIGKSTFRFLGLNSLPIDSLSP